MAKITRTALAIDGELLGKFDAWMVRHGYGNRSQAVRDLKLEPLNLDIAAALLVSTLPQHHKDPFDRMLVCQAMAHNLTILTPDRLIQQYGVPCLW